MTEKTPKQDIKMDVMSLKAFEEALARAIATDAAIPEIHAEKRK